MLANLVSDRFNSVLECPRGGAICQIFVGKISRAAASVCGHPYIRISSSKLIRKFATLISDYFPPPFPCFFHATSFWPTVPATLSKQDVYFWFWKIPVSRACFESNVNLPDSLRKISSHFRNFFFLVVFFYDGKISMTRRMLFEWYSRFSGIYCIKPQIIRIFLSVRIEFIVFKYLLRHIVVSIVWIFLFFFQGGWYMRIYLLLVEYGMHRKY